MMRWFCTLIIMFANKPKRFSDFIVDLQDKVGLATAYSQPKIAERGSQITQVQNDAVDALIALGYSLNDAVDALNEIDKNLAVDERIMLALRG